MSEVVQTDKIFSEQRLANIYDAHDGARIDLEPYLYFVKAFNAKSVLDVGCGTGSFLCQLAEDKELILYGVDPAKASLNVARKKKNSERITWIHGDIPGVKDISVDLTVMTGNVAQVFLTDKSWLSTLKGIYNLLRPNGRLVFESRRPHSRAWEKWTKENSFKQLKLPNIGDADIWVELTSVALPFVSFRWNHHFKKDDSFVTSDSTIIFREKEEIESTLMQTGFKVIDIYHAPDRPGEEFVFITEKSHV